MNKLWPHQEYVIDYLTKNKRAVAWVIMGGGKTRTTLELIRRVGARRVIVVSPPSVLSVWEGEAAKWNSDLRVVKLDQVSTKKRAEVVRDHIGEDCILAVNYQSVWRDPLFDQLRRFNADMVIFDEVHMLKAAGSKVSRRAATLVAKTERVVGLTGTLIPNGQQDIYGTARAIRPDLFGTNHDKFMRQYFIMGGFQGRQILGLWDNFKDDFQNKLDQFVVHVDHDYLIKSGTIELPEELHQNRFVTLKPKTMKAYRELEEHFITKVEEGYITASNVLVKALRLLQFSSGIMQVDDAPHPIMVDDAKLKATEEWLEEVGSDPAVIWTQFKAEVDEISKMLTKKKISYSQLTGSVKQLADWKAGRTQVLVVNMAAGAEGIDLTRSRHALYFSLSYNYKNYIQSVARTSRPGADVSLPVLYTYLVAADTIDGDVANALVEKHDISQIVMGRLTNAYR